MKEPPPVKACSTPHAFPVKWEENQYQGHLTQMHDTSYRCCSKEKTVSPDVIPFGELLPVVCALCECVSPDIRQHSLCPHQEMNVTTEQKLSRSIWSLAYPEN